MLSPLEIRALVRGVLKDQLNVLGTYHFDEDTVDEAIAVLPDPDLGMNYPDSSTTIQGIEVVITIPYAGAVPLMGSGLMQPRQWDVRLKQWNRQGDLISASDALAIAIAKQLPILIHPTLPIPANEALGMPEQVSIRFSEFSAN